MPCFALPRYMSVAALLVAAVFTGSAFALCPVTPARYVGPASDAQCDFHSIQEGIDANPGCPVNLFVSRGKTYSEAITINNQSVTLTGTNQCGLISGGRPDSPNTAPARATLNGDGSHPVLTITGSSHVNLSNFVIRQGAGPTNAIAGAGGVSYSGTGALSLQNVEVADNHGAVGGIAYVGAGSLTLNGVSIHNNQAQHCGGGVGVIAGSAQTIDATITDHPDVVNEIYENDATECGGGIYASGAVHLSAITQSFDRLSIHHNEALQGGGGIEWDGTRGADLGFSLASLTYNRAQFGGGIAVAAPGAQVRVFTTHSQWPAGIDNNTATTGGGALYVGGGDASSFPSACLFDVSMNANTAVQYGAAIQLGAYGHASINAEGESSCDYTAVAALGAQHCSLSGETCNRLSFNAGVNNGSPTTASTVSLDHHAIFRSRRTKFVGNSGGSLIAGSVATGAEAHFYECLVYYNSASGPLVATGAASMSFDGCTFARDDVGAAKVFDVNAPLAITRSIVAESVAVYDPDNSPGLSIQYSLLNTPTRPTDATVSYGAPGFVDAQHDDYHLTAASTAVDYAYAGASLGGDLDRQPREVDDPARTNLYGLRDLGPYERQSDGVTDRIFLGTFE